MEQLIWAAPEWIAGAHAWIREQLDGARMELTGEITQPHVRPWSTAMCIPTNAGTVWFKAATPPLAHEPALTALLAGLAPEHLPGVLAAEPGEGWMITRDMGEPLRSRITSVEDLALWRPVIQAYVDVQMRAADHAADVLATGVPDRASNAAGREALRTEWDELLADTDSLLIGQGESISRERYEAALRLWPHVEALLDKVTASGLPPTVVHDDLHDANVFANGEEFTISDWGEVSLANPLSTLTVFLRSAAYMRGLPDDAAEIVALRDLFIGCWSDWADQGAIRRAAPAAERLGMLHRSLTWRNAIRSAPPGSADEWADAVGGWLDEFVSTFE